MICRHSPGDPSCSSHPEHPDNPRNRQHTTDAPTVWSDSNSPKPEEFQVQRVEVVGPHMVLQVLYPSCARCAYEGRKVLVFLNTSTLAGMRWRKMDPHFADPKKSARRGPDEAPAPAARFPASEEGWQDALDYAASKDPTRSGPPVRPRQS